MMEFSSGKTYGIFSTPRNKQIIAKIRESQANVIEFSYGEILKRELTKDEEKLLIEIRQCDWLVFKDVFSADLFIEKLEELEIDIYELDEIRICSFGEAVADRFRFVQLHSDIIAQKIDEMLIADSILNYIGDSEDSVNSKILVSGIESNQLLEDILRSKKVQVEKLKIADFENIRQSEQTLKKTKLKGGTVDEFIFTSVEDVMQFKLQFAAEFADSDIFETIWGTDEITLKTLDEFGIKGFYLNK